MKYFILLFPIMVYCASRPNSPEEREHLPLTERIRIPVVGRTQIISGLLFYAYTNPDTGRTNMYDVSESLSLEEIAYFDNYFRELEARQRAVFEATNNNRSHDPGEEE